VTPGGYARVLTGKKKEKGHVSFQSIKCLLQWAFCIGEGPEYRPFRDLRSVPKASRPREQVKNHRTTCTKFPFLCKGELRFFQFLEIVTCWRYLRLVRRSQFSLAGTFHLRRSGLLKTGFLQQVRELKIQRKNPSSALGSSKCPMKFYTL
jgi:hypothetical protein